MAGRAYKGALWVVVCHIRVGVYWEFRFMPLFSYCIVLVLVLVDQFGLRTDALDSDTSLLLFAIEGQKWSLMLSSETGVVSWIKLWVLSKPAQLPICIVLEI